MNEQVITDFIEFKIYNLNESECTINVMQALLVAMSELVESQCMQHLWQCDVFRLTLVESSVAAGGVPMHFGARLEVCDNIEDEWFVMYLLRAISRQFAQLAITAVDSDGHFLLIEAAHELPSWLDPDCSDNRLFLVAGGKWLLLDEKPLDVQLSVPLALRALRARIASRSANEHAAIARLLNARIDVHPQRAHEQSTHRVRVRVPRDVAVALDALPQLVAPAVALFYAREPSDIAACSRMQRFGSTALVDVRVRFSRCLYAQMARQQFFVPRGTSFVVPIDESHVDRKASQIGMQLACAFEMLACRAKKNTKIDDSSGGDNSDVIDSIRKMLATNDDDAELERKLFADKRQQHALTRW